jgi:ankyrin repeat protein
MSVLTLAIINGRLDIAAFLLDHGADPKLLSKSGIGPLYATVDARWPERTWYPPASVNEEKTTHLELLQKLLAKGADPDARLGKKPWYRTFHGDWVDPVGATAFWLAAKANDVDAMKVLIAGGANPTIPSAKGVSPLLVACGYGLEPQVTNFAPSARLAAVKYLVDATGADVNARDAQGYTPLHGAALTANHEVIEYLVAMGADITARAGNVFGGEGQADKEAAGGRGDTVADMANGPRAHNMQFPETVEFLERLGSENSNNCRYATCVVKTLPSAKK